MQFIPTQKSYSWKIGIQYPSFKFWRKTRVIEFNYKQSTLREISDYMSNKDLTSWYYNFVKKNSNANDKDCYHILTNFTDVKKKIDETFFEGLTGGEKQEGSSSPFYSYIAYVLEHTNETLETLFNFTMEQLKFITDGIVWNIKEKSGDKKHKFDQLKQQGKESQKNLNEKQLKWLKS